MTDENILSILRYANSIWASDIHFSEDKNIVFRVYWKLQPLEKAWTLTRQDMRNILSFVFKKDEKIILDFYKSKDYDFAFVSQDWVPFRCNAFYRLWRLSLVMRLILSEASTMEELKLPQSAKKFTKAKQWLILITGPTGSGKSTTMVSILDEINKQRWEHIITIEDPIEFIFKDKKSVFSQREVWTDTSSFAKALKASMREDPDIIMVWEIRDKDTVEAAMELAETGHLVFSTLHTSGSVSTITRLLSFFPPDMQNSVREKLSESLFWVLSQRLIPTPDRKWRVWIFEIMMMTPWIRSLVREWKLVQINSNIETWKRDGMILMKEYADEQAQQWFINTEDYINYFKDDMENNK